MRRTSVFVWRQQPSVSLHLRYWHAVIALLIPLLFAIVCMLILNRPEYGSTSLAASDLTPKEKQVEWQKMKKWRSIQGQ